MLQVVKKVASWAKRIYMNAINAGKEQVFEQYGNARNTVSHGKPTDYWAELAEQERILQLAQEYHERQEKLAQQTTKESLKDWRQNNAAVNEYFKKKYRAEQKSRLRIVQSA